MKNFKSIYWYLGVSSFISLYLNSAYLQAEENTFEQDVKSIKAMAGCFEVEFNFVETFSLTKNYQPRAERYKAKALEWVTIAEESEKRILLQHLLMAGDDVIKHWGADWLYESPDLYEYQGPHVYVPVSRAPEQIHHTWTQRVTQVDDGPREQCAAAWIHANGRDYWECTDLSPLPRRESSEMNRKDYQALQRGEREEITPTGWMQNQDNLKIILKDGVKTSLVAEKGLTYFKRIDENRCLKASEFWKTQSDFWKIVRGVWREFLDGKKILSTDGKALYLEMSDLQEEVADGSLANVTAIQSQIRSLIQKHLQ